MITINYRLCNSRHTDFGDIVDRTGSYAIAWHMPAAFLTVGIIG